MSDLKELIERELESFIEWDGDDKSIVTTTSAKLFAEHVAGLWADHVAGARKMVAAVQGEPTLVAWVLYDATADQKYIKKNPDDGSLAIFDSEAAARRARTMHPGSDYKRVDYYAAPQPPFQLPDFATDPDDSDEVASLWDHGFKRGWNSCLGAVAKAMQSAEQKPAPDVAGLVEALECARNDLSDWITSFPEAAHTHTTIVIARIDAALAPYRKGGGK